jgi:ABC-type Na+ transport system ATPase subunit NatA
VADERVRTFSAGMRQKVAVARAIGRDHELLSLDEPNTGDVAGAREAVDDMMLRASREGRTLVIATHHRVAPGLAARVVTLRDGSVETAS